jgi:filamentous hemagglutinin
VAVGTALVIDGALSASAAVNNLDDDLNKLAMMRSPSNYSGNTNSKSENKITRSEHATIRSTQGRNVNTAINDVQRARPADVLLQNDGRWVIRGQNGRAHILESNGEIVTTMDNVTNANVQQRIARGRWSKLSLSEQNLFQKLFYNYVNW